MGLVWAKHKVRGYTRPTPFSAKDAEKSDRHAHGIVEEYSELLQRYCGEAWRGLDVLELGPGGTLATGAYILKLGAKSYFAFDAFPLAANIDEQLYRQILGERWDALAAAVAAKDSPPFTYAVDRTFHVDEAVGEQRFDRIVSCAAFEHFDDPADTVRRMTRAAKPGAVACLRIDFSTHSRGLRERDPNNIYRFPDWLYWALPYPGKPNRIRPGDYLAMMAAAGWKELELVPVRSAEPAYLAKSSKGLAAKFRSPEARMDVLSGVVLGRLGDGLAAYRPISGKLRKRGRRSAFF